MKKISSSQIGTWRIVLLLTFFAYLLTNAYLYFILETQLSFASSGIVLLLKVFPLLICLPWVLKPNYKASLFFCLLLMLYFAFSAIAMFGQGEKGHIAILDGVLVCILFSTGFILGKLHKE